VLGLGNEIRLRSSNDIDRRSSEFLYLDNNVLGTRVSTRAELVDSDDGFTRTLHLGKPFFELDSRDAWGLQLERHERIDELFLRGEEIAGVVHELEDYAFEVGRSDGLQGGFSRRWSYGYGFRRDRFSISDRLPAPAQLPADRELSYPYLRFESIEDNYVTALNLNQIYLTEDVELGSRLQARLGLAAEALGFDQDRLVLDASYSDTLRYDGRSCGNTACHWTGSGIAARERWRTSWCITRTGTSIGRVTGSRSFPMSRPACRTTSTVTVSCTWAASPVAGPSATAFRPGIAALCSALKSATTAVGIGLRLGSSKSASARVAHIDFAIPLTNKDDPAVDSFEISVAFKGSF
jgi:hypothetical protein